MAGHPPGWGPQEDGSYVPPQWRVGPQRDLSSLFRVLVGVAALALVGLLLGGVFYLGSRGDGAVAATADVDYLKGSRYRTTDELCGHLRFKHSRKLTPITVNSNAQQDWENSATRDRRSCWGPVYGTRSDDGRIMVSLVRACYYVGAKDAKDGWREDADKHESCGTATCRNPVAGLGEEACYRISKAESSQRAGSVVAQHRLTVRDDNLVLLVELTAYGSLRGADWLKNAMVADTKAMLARLRKPE